MKKLTVDSQKLIFYDMQLNQLIKTRVEESLEEENLPFSVFAHSSNLKNLLLKKSRLVTGLFDCDVGLVVH